MNIFSLAFGDTKAHLDGKFSSDLEGDFEERPQQIHMLKAVQKALETKRHLIVEAGTGVGKSLAYLLPLIHWALTYNKKVVVSTYTKTLQEQIVQKDLPRLRDILELNFRFALCIGSQNYLCMRRLSRENTLELFDSAQERQEMDALSQWVKTNPSGRRSDIQFPLNPEIWNKVSRDADLCLGKKCKFHSHCFYYKAKNREYGAHILVTNHHLYFSHVASGGKVLPKFDAVVFDEAHTLEDVATSYLGMDISNFQTKFLYDMLLSERKDKGFLSGLKGVPEDVLNTVKVNLADVRFADQLFFSGIMIKYGEASGTNRIREKYVLKNNLKEPLMVLIDSLKKIFAYIQDEDDQFELTAFISRLEKFFTILENILGMSLEDYVYWVEVTRRYRGVKYTLTAAPLNISEAFHLQVLEEVQPVILTSATLSIDGGFEFLKRNLGFHDADTDELALDSPFDYARKVLMYAPQNIPEPSVDMELFEQTSIVEMIKIVGMMNGRTFILFTSFKMMGRACDQLRQEFEELRFLKQGEAPQYQLIKTFKQYNNTILLGTNTFWQGIDVPGRDLECVIISKLPFAVPDEPIVEAKMEYLKARDRNPFFEYQVPRAVIMFKQGFGRLIRTQQDRGMVAVMDPRLRTKAYGQTFLNSLPRCRYISNLKYAQEFFNE